MLIFCAVALRVRVQRACACDLKRKIVRAQGSRCFIHASLDSIVAQLDTIMVFADVQHRNKCCDISIGFWHTRTVYLRLPFWTVVVLKQLLILQRMSRLHWDFSYVPNGEDMDKTRFLRLHAMLASMPNPSHGTVVIIHGGYWKNTFGLDDDYQNAGTATLAPFFVQCGFTAIEVEYRRRDHAGGGWPGTNDDIFSAIRRLCELKASVDKLGEEAHMDSKCIDAINRLRLENLILLGHSAGGCLALWAAHQHAALSALPCRLRFVVALAPIADLVKGHEMQVSDEGDAVELYMKGAPDTTGGLREYQKASPAALLPLSFPLLVVHGDMDADVPPQLVADYIADATHKSSGCLSKVLVPGADHFDVVNADSIAWKKTVLPAIATMIEHHIGDAAAKSIPVSAFPSL